MKSKIECYRCKTKISVNLKNLKKVQKCSHCQGLMAINKKTMQTLKYMRYAVVTIVVGILMFACMQVGTMESYIAVMISVVFATTIAMYSEKICLYLTWKFFGLNYEEYHSEKERKRQIKPKMRSN